MNNADGAQYAESAEFQSIPYSGNWSFQPPGSSTRASLGKPSLLRMAGFSLLLGVSSLTGGMDPLSIDRQRCTPSTARVTFHPSFRRRISLREARAMAMNGLLEAEARRLRWAEDEARRLRFWEEDV